MCGWGFIGKDIIVSSYSSLEHWSTANLCFQGPSCCNPREAEENLIDLVTLKLRPSITIDYLNNSLGKLYQHLLFFIICVSPFIFWTHAYLQKNQVGEEDSELNEVDFLKYGAPPSWWIPFFFFLQSLQSI